VQRAGQFRWQYPVCGDLVWYGFALVFNLPGGFHRGVVSPSRTEGLMLLATGISLWSLWLYFVRHPGPSLVRTYEFLSQINDCGEVEMPSRCCSRS